MSIFSQLLAETTARMVWEAQQGEAEDLGVVLGHQEACLPPTPQTMGMCLAPSAVWQCWLP